MFYFVILGLIDILKDKKTLLPEKTFKKTIKPKLCCGAYHYILIINTINSEYDIENTYPLEQPCRGWVFRSYQKCSLIILSK